MKLDNIILIKLSYPSIWFRAVAQTRDIPIAFGGNVDHEHLHGLCWSHSMDINMAPSCRWTTDPDMNSSGNKGYSHLYGLLWHHSPWTPTWLQAAAQTMIIPKVFGGNVATKDINTNHNCYRTMDKDMAPSSSMATNIINMTSGDSIGHADVLGPQMSTWFHLSPPNTPSPL